jgi:hypothetical protein
MRRSISPAAFVERHGRAELEAFVASAIDLLDSIDGDADLEPEEDRCEAGDDGCGCFVGGQAGGVHWGSAHEAAGELLPVPTYGVDQTDMLPPFHGRQIPDPDFDCGEAVRPAGRAARAA